MAENMIKFLRGNVASLPQTATAGAVYFTKDEGLYLGLADGTYHRYGDFITVADVDSLPAAGAHETCMYYCISENILAKWSGTEWVQINKQKTLAELGGVAKSVYETKIAALEKADSDNATAISNLTTYVGTLPEGVTATNVIAYIDAKTSGIASDTALTELAGKVATAESDIDKLEAALAEGGDTYKAIAAAKAAGDAAQADVDALELKVGEVAEGKTVVGLIGEAQTQANKGVADAATAQAKADSAYTLANGRATMEQVNTAIANAGHAVKADVDKTIADMDAAYKKADGDMKTELEGKINAKVAQSDYDTKVAELAGADTTLQGNIDDLANKVGTPTEGKTIVQMIADAQTAATYDDTEVKGLISDNADAIDAIAEDYLKKADKEELQGNIDTLTGVVETLRDGIDAEKVDGVKDLIKYVEDHGSEVTGMKEDIAENAKAISEHEALAAETYETKTDAAKKLVDAKAYADTEVGKDRERLIALEGKVDVEKVSTAIAGEKTRAEGVEAELAAADATNLQAAKDYADEAVEALGIGDYVKKADADKDYAAAGHNHDDKYDAKGDAAQALIDAKAYADGLADDYAAAKHDHVVADITDFESAVATKVESYGYATTGYADGKASAAQSAAEAQAAELDAALKSELQAEIDTDVKVVNDALEGYKTSNNAEVAKKANAADVYTKVEIEAMLTWGSF